MASDRYLAGRLAERRFACTIHLLDDGFQHMQLARDVDLLVMSRSDLDEDLLPSGRLREPLAAGRGADAVLVTGGDDDMSAVAARMGVGTAFRVVPRYRELRLVEPLRALRMIHFSAWIARRWEDSAFKLAFPDFGTEHYWQEQIEALALQLEKLQYPATDLYY